MRRLTVQYFMKSLFFLSRKAGVSLKIVMIRWLADCLCNLRGDEI